MRAHSTLFSKSLKMGKLFSRLFSRRTEPTLPTFSVIVAADEENAIGSRGRLPWLIPEDLRYFARTTKGATVIIGRRMWESLPEHKRPLPGRLHLVVSEKLGTRNWDSMQYLLKTNKGSRPLGFALVPNTAPETPETPETSTESQQADAEGGFRSQPSYDNVKFGRGVRFSLEQVNPCLTFKLDPARVDLDRIDIRLYGPVRFDNDEAPCVLELPGESFFSRSKLPTLSTYQNENWRTAPRSEM